MRRRTHGLKGNTITRSRATFNPGIATRGEFRPDDSTKFYLRPRSYKTRAMWKKYPTPFVFKNPVPEGDAVVVRKYYPNGTRDKLAAEVA